MVFFLFSFIALALRTTAHEDVACGTVECPDASQSKPRAGSAMLQKHSQASLTQEKGRSMSAKRTEFVSPQDLMSCDGEIVATTKCMTSDTYDTIVERIEEILKEELDQACEGGNCEMADWAGCVLRMAGHDFMDHINGMGGADGCTDMTDGDNAGLPECLSSGEFGFSLNSIYPEFCTQISFADFEIVSAQAVMSLLATEGEPREVLAAGLKDNFQFGRTTLTGDACKEATHWSGNHLLPNPAGGCPEVERVFVNNMGLTWKEATALMGVHSLGRAKIENSGFNGWWDTPEHSRTFNNHYYVALIATSWCPELNVDGNTAKHQWVRCDVGTKKMSHKEMMLNTDMCLAYTAMGGGPLIAGEPESNCCAWVHTNVGDYPMQDVIASNNGDTFCNVKCGETFVDAEGTNQTMVCYSGGKQGFREHIACCHQEWSSLSKADCWTPGLGDEERDPGIDNAPAAGFVRQFAADEMEWISTFLTAWTKAVENGFDDSLQPLCESSCVFTLATVGRDATATCVSTEAPTPAPTGRCKDACATNTKGWNKMCKKDKCAGCPECAEFAA